MSRLVLIVSSLFAATVCGVAAEPLPTRALLITLDGLRPDAITPAEMPRVSALAASGAFATATNDLPSATLPNHMTLLTGVLAEHHRVYVDWELPGRTSRPTILTIAEDSGLRCAFFASKDKLAFLAVPDRLEAYLVEAKQALLAGAAVDTLKSGAADVIFVHFRDPDSTGHKYGWMSPEYLAACASVDALVGELIDAAHAPGAAPTYVALTADHGGKAFSHFLNTPEDRQIPWIIAGPGIAAGTKIEADVSIVDMPATLLWLLDIAPPETFDGCVIGEVRSDPSARAEARSDLPAIGPPCALFAALPMIGLLRVFRIKAK